jgi:hypothetical protein
MRCGSCRGEGGWCGRRCGHQCRAARTVECGLQHVHGLQARTPCHCGGSPGRVSSRQRAPRPLRPRPPIRAGCERAVVRRWGASTSARGMFEPRTCSLRLISARAVSFLVCGRQKGARGGVVWLPATAARTTGAPGSVQQQSLPSSRARRPAAPLCAGVRRPARTHRVPHAQQRRGPLACAACVRVYQPLPLLGGWWGGVGWGGRGARHVSQAQRAGAAEPQRPRRMPAACCKPWAQCSRHGCLLLFVRWTGVPSGCRPLWAARPFARRRPHSPRARAPPPNAPPKTSSPTAMQSMSALISVVHSIRWLVSFLDSPVRSGSLRALRPMARRRCRRGRCRRCCCVRWPRAAGRTAGPTCYRGCSHRAGGCSLRRVGASARALVLQRLVGPLESLYRGRGALLQSLRCSSCAVRASTGTSSDVLGRCDLGNTAQIC